MISTSKLIEELERISPNGFQLSYKFGLINSTKAIYYKNLKIYIFNIGDEFFFKERNGYTKEEFLEKYSNCFWEIELAIS